MSDEPLSTGSDEFDPLARELCPDGACIGVIGPDGRCKECGKPGRGAGLDPRTQGLRSDDELTDELDDGAVDHDLPASPDDFDERRLCPDGACIGVIGPGGRCKECGRPADAG